MIWRSPSPPSTFPLTDRPCPQCIENWASQHISYVTLSCSQGGLLWSSSMVGKTEEKRQAKVCNSAGGRRGSFRLARQDALRFYVTQEAEEGVEEPENKKQKKLYDAEASEQQGGGQQHKGPCMVDQASEAVVARSSDNERGCLPCTSGCESVVKETCGRDGVTPFPLKICVARSRRP
jgi:hypothetical protein